MNTIFLTAVEVAKILKISKALAYRLIAQGEISSIRFGRTVRVRQDFLDEFIENKLSTVTQGQFQKTISSPKQIQRRDG